MKEARSGIDVANIEEVLGAEDSAAWATLAGQNQYFTPDWLVKHCMDKLPARNPLTLLDPQCGDGSLVKPFSAYTFKCGIEIDNRVEHVPGAQIIKGNCMKVWELVDELFPELRFHCVNANPPFGKRWEKADGTVIDSTQATWDFVTKHGNYGFFISNAKTIERLGLDKHPWVYAYEKHENVWQNCDVVAGVVFWKQPATLRGWMMIDTNRLSEAWTKLTAIMEEEAQRRPKWNIYLDHAGYLQTYLSIRSETKFKISRANILRLHSVKGCHPLTLTTEKETRDLMKSLVSCGLYQIEPAAKLAIEQALEDMTRQGCPIMPVTDFERVAYADEEEALECIQTARTHNMEFTAGRTYKITTGTYKFTQKFKRRKPHYNEETRQMFMKDHDCTLSGQDRYISIVDDRRQTKRFMDKVVDESSDFPEAMLWTLFKKPEVKTITDVQPALFEQNLAVLRSCAMLAGYEYYPGQLPYLGRVAVKHCGLVAGDTGTGKTLMALSLLAMKGPKRALIIAPQGTMRSSDEGDPDDDDAMEYNASQWVSEIQKFTPYLQVWELFTPADYTRIKSQNGGELPSGVYISYYQAMFLNGGREKAPATWTDDKLADNCKREFGKLGVLPEMDDDNPRYWCDTVGQEVDGIRCIIFPCLSTLIGHEFDMVMLDEAHLCTNLDANLTQMMIRLQPKYRYALTATPIPNVISNLFSLMGWIAVEDWFKGGRRNAAWPYSRTEIGRFNTTFLSQERDHTSEEMKRAADPRWRGNCVRNSPVISSPARLLKLLKPSMAYISKPECNPGYKEPKIVDVRVPMGQEQAALYKHFLNRSNVPGNHPLVRARRQTAFLRAICADPAGFRRGGPTVRSNMNPKIIAALELVRDMLKQGEQVTIISARVGQSDTLQRFLTDAGVAVSRIDSTIPPAQHSYQANLFKQKKTQVMLMGIKCAAAHSFSQCIYEIIMSLEYSPGPFNQAKGRVDRVNSRPGVTIFCILHKLSIEETQFDVVATKNDAATICLHGKRIPRDFKPVDASEILAAAIERFDVTGATPEMECELAWPKLQKAIKDNLTLTSPLPC